MRSKSTSVGAELRYRAAPRHTGNLPAPEMDGMDPNELDGQGRRDVHQVHAVHRVHVVHPRAVRHAPGSAVERSNPWRFGLGVLLTITALTTACSRPAPETEAPEEPRPPVEATSRVDRAVATTGDVITYTVTVNHDPAYEVDLPEPGAEIAGFRIIDIGREDPREERGRRIEERWYQLRADLVGSYVLPPVRVTYRPKPAAGDEGETPAEDAGETPAEAASIETSEIFVEVQSVLNPEATDIRGLKPLREIERPTPWWWFAAGGGAVLLLGLAAFIFWRRSRRTVVAPPRPAHEIAFEALDRLRRTDFEDLEAMRLFHFEISEVIRAYVENRFGLNATDLTTEEIVGRLDEIRGLDADSSHLLRRFLGATDQVKFAAYVPSEEEIGATYEGALSFVEATRWRPAPAAGEEAAPPGDATPIEEARAA